MATLGHVLGGLLGAVDGEGLDGETWLMVCQFSTALDGDVGWLVDLRTLLHLSKPSQNLVTACIKSVHTDLGSGPGLVWQTFCNLKQVFRVDSQHICACTQDRNAELTLQKCRNIPRPTI